MIQAAPVVFDRDATLEKVRTLAASAASQGARLAVFPEAFVSAYPKGLDFGAVIGSRAAEGREDFRRYFESAVDVPGGRRLIFLASSRATTAFTLSSA